MVRSLKVFGEFLHGKKDPIELFNLTYNILGRTLFAGLDMSMALGIFSRLKASSSENPGSLISLRIMNAYEH